MMRWFRNFLARRFGIKPEPFYIAHHLWSGLTLDSWRSSASRIKYAQELLKTPTFREMMNVLKNTAPVPDLSDASRAAMEAGRVRGYQQAIATLLIMAEPVEQPGPEPEADYSRTLEQTMDLEE